MSVPNKDIVALLFAVRRSARYHDCRVAHFQTLQRLTNVSNILLSGVVILDLFGAEIARPVKAFAALTAVFGAFDLVLGFGRCADAHRDLKRRFLSLERRILSDQADGGQQRWMLERLEIESEEPPVYRALDTLCHNQMLLSEHVSETVLQDNLRVLPWYVRISANWLKWTNIADIVSRRKRRADARTAKHPARWGK